MICEFIKSFIHVFKIKLRDTPRDNHNEYTYTWTTGYRETLLETLKYIDP